VRYISFVLAMLLVATAGLSGIVDQDYAKGTFFLVLGLWTLHNIDDKAHKP